MRTARTNRRRTTTLALALATSAASTFGLGVAAAAPSAAADTAQLPDVPVAVTDADARTGVVAAVMLGADGRPTYVEVVAPTVEQAVQKAARLPGSDGVAIDAPMTALAVNDPLRSQQWNLDRLRADSLPAATAGGLVAVVDSGVRASHEDFRVGQVRCDLGADFTTEQLSSDGCVDPKGHGTHVAGIVGAVADNSRGVASVAPGTALLPVRVLDSAGNGGSIAVARGIVHAADKGAQVINLSLGGPGGSSALDDAVRYATGRGALVVVSAGNNRMEGNEVNYPAASPGALSVASTDISDTSSSFSYSGPSVDIAAPGGGIISTWGTGDRSYAKASGTSMAAPAVSAVASLYRAAHPSATPADVTAALVGSATDLEGPGRDDNTGAGLVNPYALLVSGQPAPAQPAPAQPAPVQPAPAQPAPVQPAPAQPAPAPVQPAPVQPAPPVVSQPAPVVSPPARKAVVKVPAPRLQPVSARVARRQAVAVRLSDYRPASTVTVLETFRVAQRVKVKVNGRTVTRTRTVARTVVLGTFRVAADGRVSTKVMPVQLPAGTLVVRGFDRGGKVVQRTAPIRVG